MNISEILQQLEAYENPYVDLYELRKELEKANIVVEDIIEQYDGASIDICLENDRHVLITVSKFKSGGYTLDICNCSSGLHTAIEEVDNKEFVIAVIKNVCQQTLDYKVPEKRKLNLEVDMSKGVSVSSKEASTTFCNMRFLPVLDENEVRENFKKLLKLCRENKITVKGRKNAEAKLALYPQYLEDVTKYNDGIKELQNDWNEIVKEGIYTGWGDNKKIEQADEKRFALERLLHGNMPLSKYREIARDIKDKLEKITYNIEHPHGTQYTMIGF